MDYTVQITVHNKSSNNTFREIVNRKVFLKWKRQDLITMKNPKFDFGKQYIKIEDIYLYVIYTILNPTKEEYSQWLRDTNALRVKDTKVINH